MDDAKLESLAKSIFGENAVIRYRDGIDPRDCVIVFAPYGTTKQCCVFFLRHNNARELAHNIFSGLITNGKI